ncbi:MAG: DUF192 domain-containing protein [bacterium]|nr:DUF192 domain-containing protein [bacterium]
MKRILWLLVLIVAAGALPSSGGSAPATPAPPGAVPGDGLGTLRIYQDGLRATLQVEIVASVETRSKGLMFRKSLPKDAGMLFVFEVDGRWGFWMKNTLIPLSIGFIDSRWRLLEILDMQVAPDPANGPFTIYEPSAPYRYALEVDQGYFKRKGITPGARLELVPK